MPAAELVSKLRTIRTTRSLILLTATRDVRHSGATVLRSIIVNSTAATQKHVVGNCLFWHILEI
jgi:hypothetical protein